MTADDIRKKYLEFYKKREHAVLPSAPLVPENDPTTLFTGSGMQPLVPYLLGKTHPAGARLSDSQKSFRAGDIEEVGDNRHTTFFEMLGNWSLGDYFKEEQLPWIFEFLTDVVGIDPNKLYVTVFLGDDAKKLPRDTESAAIWRSLFAKKGIEAAEVELGSEDDGYQKGMQGGRIFYYDASKNWWSRAGIPEHMPSGEPGGPDSEIFYDFSTPHDPAYGTECHPNCDCGRFLEIGNSVFMQFVKKEDGSFGLLPKQNLDFGGGLERIAAAAADEPDVFRIDLFAPLVQEIEEATGKHYGENPDETKAFRVVLDHVRAASFLIGDGVRPSNVERGYIVRRLIRRAVRFADMLGFPEGRFEQLAMAAIEPYAEAYAELAQNKYAVMDAFREEEERFRKTLKTGLREFDKLAAAGKTISGSDAFTLFSTFGFPLELTLELALERGITVDDAGFRMEMEQHQDRSRAGAEQKFKGGLADASEATMRLHTAHHLLLKALQQVLGPSVKQRGSNITSERLRIDFSHGEKMTPEQKEEVEKIVNEKIAEALPVVRSVLPKDEAEKLGAEHEFGAKYPDMVSVYSVGPAGASESSPNFAQAFSIEFCGGPHAVNTSELKGHFRIKKEEAVAAGVRRIKAVLE